MPAKILLPFLAGMVVSLALGWPLLQFLRRLKAKQYVSSDAPQSHQAKGGTPTMGGLIILAGALLGSLLTANWDRSMTALAALIVVAVGFAAIGFLDDYLIVRRGRNLGLKARQKLAGQFLLAIGFVYWYHTWFLPPAAPAPGEVSSPLLDFAWQAFQVLLLVGMSNAVNLTDGLDGLAAGVALPVWLVLAILATLAGGGNLQAAGFAAAFAGASAGYLWFNAHPAQVFMGDTGALSIGAAMAAAAILIHQEWILLLAGGIHVVEAGSVTLQVISFKSTGKRIFLMSPLHHHFELAGWPETRVVTRFTIASILLCGVALYLGFK